MRHFFNRPLQIGSLTIANRLIQGPLAGFSCAPYRRLFYHFTPPAYCVSEMLSAHDVVQRHHAMSRYLYRAKEETLLCYQISGSDPGLMAEAAAKLESLSANIIDINCGCPKAKIRKKGAGSALLEQPQLLQTIIRTVKANISCPLTLKIRLQGNEADLALAQMAAETGVDALIIHGRRWVDDYDKPCDLKQIARIKSLTQLPVIANGDISDYATLLKCAEDTGCDAYMISRAATGKPWLYQELLTDNPVNINASALQQLFMDHLQGLMNLENEHQAVLQSKSLVRYYFREKLNPTFLERFYGLTNLAQIEQAILVFG